MARVLLNQPAGTVDPAEHGFAAPGRAPLAFHRQLPGYAPTPLVAAPQLAQRLGVGQVWVKDESSRLGMPSYKILGASWATYRALTDLLGLAPDAGLDALRAALQAQQPLTLVAATDGNHGRAVARMARELDLAAHILVPDGTAEARITAIEGEGASVEVVDGTYDDAIARAAALADATHAVISDTAWEGYDRVPRWVIEGYSTVFWEIDDALGASGDGDPDVVAVQIGVGALAAAAVLHYRVGRARARLVGVEPETAACALAAVAAGRLVTVPGPHRSIMAGLNCGVASPVALPLMAAGIDAFVAVDDEAARVAMRWLADVGVESGESGAAGLAGITALLRGARGDALRGALGLGPASVIVLLSTEGATDPNAYRAIVGASRLSS